MAMISAQKVRQVEQLLDADESRADVAGHLGVSYQVVRKISRGDHPQQIRPDAKLRIRRICEELSKVDGSGDPTPEEIEAACARLRPHKQPVRATQWTAPEAVAWGFDCL